MSDPRQILLGLTGSVGMGKTTTAQILIAAGIPVWDADAAVHAAYAAGGAAVAPVAMLVPAALHDGAIDRAVLRAALDKDPALLSRLEAIVHPIIAQDREAFRHRHPNAPILAYDIPLLFETGADAWLDAVLVVTAPAGEQARRVLARPGMTPERLAQIVARQMPDAQKRARADFVIDTAQGLEHARAQALDVLARLRARLKRGRALEQDGDQTDA